ncbi:hypothetical protein J437_LFUL015717 [Ladona fulva]|uniref:Reverse transcriptase domain-containing protein n=1 Tax=Ladona fulva TaxID=123851 RepID=A0A8K0P4E6_LADFU|nr:hypothetical protein J437_LFUL015717 [Ladona fulva]
MASRKLMSDGLNCSIAMPQKPGWSIGSIPDHHQCQPGLGPLAFAVDCMDTATVYLQSPHPWSVLYADDMSQSETEDCPALQSQTQACKDWLAKDSMHLNIKKTEYLECPQTKGTITINFKLLTKVTKFKYLGSLIT